MVGRSWDVVGLLGLAGSLASSGCGGGGDEVVVAAAASLTEAFTEIGAAYEEARPDVEVTFNFAASSEVAAQVLEGAPIDVFASADTVNMDRIVAAGAVVGEPVVFATNGLAVVVEPGNPLGIVGVEDLVDPDLTDGDVIVVLCAPEVPCGRYASTLLDRAGLDVEPASFEENVKAVVAKVALGEADAGIAYRTDVVAAAGEVDGVAIPDDLDVVADYPIAVTAEADVGPGRDFVDFVLGADGRAILADHGFGPP